MKTHMLPRLLGLACLGLLATGCPDSATRDRPAGTPRAMGASATTPVATDAEKTAETPASSSNADDRDEKFRAAYPENKIPSPTLEVNATQTEGAIVTPGPPKKIPTAKVVPHVHSSMCDCPRD
jgi:hypothetical protein